MSLIVPNKGSTCVPFLGLDPSSETQKLRAKIVNQWVLYNSKTGNSIEMVLVDEQGVRLHVAVEDEYVKKHHKFLKEGQCLSINAFALKDYVGDFRTSDIPYKVSFLRTTRLKPLLDFPTEVPEKYFMDFSDILNGKIDTAVLIDVIGQITNVGEIEQVATKGKNKSNAKLGLLLRDTKDVFLKCTLWGDFAKEAVKYTKERMDKTVIVVMRFMTIKEYKGDMSIANVFNATKIFYDPPTEMVMSFKSSLPSNNQMISLSDFSQISWSSYSKVDLRDEFFRKNPKKKLFQIMDSTEFGKCVTCVSIKELDITKKWYYLACKTCNIKVHEYGESSDDEEVKKLYNCRKCGDVEAVVPKFYLLFRVYDGNDFARVLFFDETAEKLLNKSAEAILSEFEEEDSLVHPEVISSLFGKRILLKLSLKGETYKASTWYVVDLFWLDEQVIEEFEELSDEEPLLLIGSGQLDMASISSSATPVSKSSRKSNGDEDDLQEQRSVNKKIKQEMKK